MSGRYQSCSNWSWGAVYHIFWQSIQQLRYFHLDQRGGRTDRHCHAANMAKNQLMQVLRQRSHEHQMEFNEWKYCSPVGKERNTSEMIYGWLVNRDNTLNQPVNMKFYSPPKSQPRWVLFAHEWNRCELSHFSPVYWLVLLLRACK